MSTAKIALLNIGNFGECNIQSKVREILMILEKTDGFEEILGR